VTRPPVKRRGTRARRKDNGVHPLVLAILQAVWRATATRRPPYYVSVDSLMLPQAPERIDAAILLAVLSGWLTAGGDPPHSVAPRRYVSAGRASPCSRFPKTMLHLRAPHSNARRQRRTGQAYRAGASATVVFATERRPCRRLCRLSCSSQFSRRVWRGRHA
jgi:hypothetical protein